MNFGILGTATIARVALVPAVQASEHDLVAVASRDADRAAAFADAHDVPRSHGSYEALLGDDDLDAVYVPLPNALHAEWTKRAADAGLHVLCEKPLGVDAAEAREMGAHCEERGVTLMEAFMYRYHPRTERAVAVVEEELGDVRLAHAAFQFPLARGQANVRLDPELAGGCLMDVGCYAVSALRQFLGEPDRVRASAHDDRGAGVDTAFAGHLEYADGAMATFTAGFDSVDAQHYRVDGTDGWLAADGAFVPRGDGGVELEYEADGRHVVESFDPVDQYRLEVEHFARCVDRGERPRTDALEAARNMAVNDALLASAERGEPMAVEQVAP